MNRPRRMVLSALTTLLLLYGGYVLLVFTLQDTLVFPVPSVSGAERQAAARTVGAREVQLTSEDGTVLYGWHVDRGRERAVLYFHGNGASVAWTGWMATKVAALGYDFVAIEYRGYPGSGGRPGEAAFHRDADTAWAFVTEQLGVPRERVVLYGQSLGGGVAVPLAARVSPAGLVLESTFSSVRKLARSAHPLLPVGTLLRHPFDSLAVAPKVTVPTLVLHSSADDLIPVAHARELASALPAAELVVVPGLGHNQPVVDSRDGDEALTAFLRRVAWTEGGPTSPTMGGPARPNEEPPRRQDAKGAGP